jgi:GNAT superfamily N-acetyltransferase
MEWTRDGYTISDDPARVDVGAVHAYLSREAYWARGRPVDVVRRSLAGSLALGLYAPGGAQAGLARAVTDRATFAYLADVFVLPAHRGRGLGVWLVQTALAHPELREVPYWTLATADAHSLYARFGFAPPHSPQRWMELGRHPRRAADER